MQRTSPLYYIAPSAITITPNANGSPDDLAVYIARGTKIKIFYPPIPALVTEGAEYQEWTLTGRNRRLADSTKPYTIYARLRKVVNSSDAAYVSIAHADAYLVFAPQIEIDGRWTDPYILSPNISSTEAMTTTDADGNVYSWGPLSEKQTQGGRTDYWWVKIGTVSAPVNGERTVDLDTGILGTELYNTDWYLQPDSLPIRIELSCKIRGKEVGLNPYVAWGESLTVSANLVEGWVKDVSLMVDHWTIARNTGDSPGDAAWNYPDGGSARQMPNGQITLAHEYNNDDFAGKPSATFSVTAWGYAGGDTLVALATALISVAAETRGEYQAELSSYIDVITVDDVGNVIGGLWRDETYTDADGQEQTVRKYRISVAVSVRRGEDILTLAPDSQENAGPGTYKIGAAPQDCTCSLENSVLVITGITNVKDGVAGSADDADFDYDAMRLMESCMVRLVIDCEGVSSISKDIPITIKHDSQPFVGADMENEHSGVSWNEKTSAFVGLPVDIPLRMWHNDTDLKITGLSIKIGDVNRKYSRNLSPYQETPFQPLLLPIGTDLFPYGIYITTTDEVVNSVKRPVLHVTRAGSTLPNQTDIIVTVTAEYAGISYERTLVHTLTRVSDLNVYSLAVTPPVVHKKKGQSDDAQTVKAAIMGNSSDDGRYELTSSEATAKKLCVMCRLLQAEENAAQLIDTAKGFTSESQWTASVSYAGWVKSDTVTTDGTTTSVLFALLQDGKLYALETEEIPVMQDGDDGTDVEFVFYAPTNTDTMPLQDLRVSYRSSTGVLLRYGGKVIDNLTGADLVTALAKNSVYQAGEYLPWVDANTQWTDEPVGVASNRTFEYYSKREKVDGVWQPFSEVHVWNHYAKDGDPALVFDLTNENSFVQAMEDGTVVGDYETTQCMVYRGGVEVSDGFMFSIDSTQHITANVNGSTVNVSAMAQKDNTTQAVVNMAVVVIKATGKANTEYAGKELLANYYVRKTYAAVVYRLALSAAAIPCNSNGQAKGGQIAFSVIRSERGSQTVLDSISAISNEGLTITYNGTKLTNNNIKDYSIIGSSSYLKVNLYKGFVNAQNPGELWDTETLPKTLDGSNGEGVAGQGIFRSIVFTRTYDDISGATVQGGQYAATADRGAGIPNNTTYNGKTYVWSDGIPQGDGDIWSASRIFTSDGLAPQNNWSSPQRMVDIPDTFDVEFCAGDPSSQPPAPTDNNRHKNSSPYGYSGQVWFDPELDKYSAAGVLRDFSVMTWRAERWTINGVMGEWAVYKIVGEQGPEGPQGPAGDSWFKSTMFVRMNSTPTKPAANKGSYTNPSPSGCVAGRNSAGTQVSWSDGIPAGDNTLWATTRSFCSDADKNDSEWSDPRKMTDTATYDVEFCPYTEDNKPSGVSFSNGQPPVPTAANRHGGSGTQVWFDPELDKNSLPSGVSWQGMVWRAEKETVNGVEGTWVITRILGENGGDGVVYYITCNRSTSWQCDSNGVVTESSKTFKLKGWKREGANAAENKAFFFRRISNGTATAETTARTEQTYTLSGTVPYTSFVVEIYETQAAATAGTQPLAQLPFDFMRQGEQGPTQQGPAGLRGLMIRVTEWEVGKEYRNDTAVTDSTVDRYLDIVTVSLKPNGDLFNPSDNTIYQCRDSHTSQASDQNADKTLKEDHWIRFTQNGPIATPLLWAARALIQYLQVHQITLTDGTVTIGGLGFGNYPIYLGGADTSSCTFRVENNGILILGTMPESTDTDKRRIVINPTGKTIGIYDSDGNLVTELSAAKYHSVKGGETSIFTNERAVSSSLSLSGGSNNEVPINNYEPKSSDDDTYNANMVASLTGMNAIETNISVWLSGWLYIHHAVIRIGVRTVANGTETFDWFGDKGVVTAGTYYRLDAWRRVKVKPGTHSIVIKVLERDSSDAFLRFGTAYVNWKADEYKAHFFGNGFSVGSNSDNHFSVYNANEDNEQNQRVNLELNNGVGGLQLTKSGLGTYIFGHRFPSPITICSGAYDTNGNFAGRLWNEKSQSVLNIVQAQSNLTNGLYVIDLSQLLYDSVGNEFPTPTALGINWMFTLTPYNTSANTATAHVKQISGSFLTIQTAVNGSKAACAFRIKIEYMGFPGDN